MYMIQEPRQQQQLHVRFVLWLKTLFFDKDFEFTEIQNVTIKLLWGMWLLSPWWNTFANSVSFRAMSELANENVWGAGVVLIAVLHLAGLVFNIHFMRKYAIFAGFLFWLFVSIMLVRTNPSGTGTIIYPILTISTMWVYLRVVAAERKE